MRIVLWCVAAIGCGGGGSGLDPELAVPDLDTGDQVTLCESFVSQICESGDPLFDSFCADECNTTSCQTAAGDGHIDDECVTVTVGEVDDCADAADMATCLQGGGCMFDAVEAACE